MTSSIYIKKIVNFGIFISFIFLFLFSLTASAQTGNTGAPPEAPAPANSLIWICTGGAPGECTFADVIGAIKKLVNWGTVFALEFSVVVIAYAGFLYMNSDGNPGKRADANKMLLSVVKGIVFILLAWLIVTLILNGLGVTGIARNILG